MDSAWASRFSAHVALRDKGTEKDTHVCEAPHTDIISQNLRDHGVVALCPAGGPDQWERGLWALIENGTYHPAADSQTPLPHNI